MLSKFEPEALFSGMKNFVPSAFLAAGALFFGVPVVATAEAPKIEAVIDLLHEAKDSSEPVPLLQKAHKQLENFKAAPNGAAAGIGPRRSAGNAAGAHEHKQKALEAIKEAIETAKSGGDVKPKIEHAVAMVHEAGNLKR
jgi:hypothetical protein